MSSTILSTAGSSVVPYEVYVLTLCVLGVGCVGLLVRTLCRGGSRALVGTPASPGGVPSGGGFSDDQGLPPGFQAFQRNYLTVYLLVTFSDWLKGPYVYALYEAYGFSTWQIAQLFIMGYISSLVFGTLTGAMSDKLGRRLACQIFCVVYALSAVTKVINDFWVLMLGRALSGVATSLLFTTFEAWMVSEHQSRGYPSRLLTDTFSKGTLMNGFGAIAAGIAAQIAAQWSYAMPFLVAIPCLIVAFILTLSWAENYGNSQIAPLATICKGVQAVKQDRRLWWLGTCEAAFEGCMYVWVFFWTPALSTEETRKSLPYGIIFASFMSAFMIGGSLPQHFKVDSLAYWLHCTALVVTALAAFLFEHKIIVFWCFVIFEGTVGCYFPSHGTIRSRAIDESTRAAVMNLFRVPLNLYVVLLLQVQWTTPQALAILALTHMGSLAAYSAFRSGGVGLNSASDGKVGSDGAA
jgi:MFS family permease